uniref:Putative lipocalin n=1 Tax=Rhipicephalus microplus TaxID=6941 RepID=A0A6G5A322_RHIMP
MTNMYHCGLVLFLVLCTAAHAVEVGDLYKALNTTEPVWMTKRNYTRNNRCVRATQVFLNLTDYEFNQTYVNSSGKQSQLLYAKLGCDMTHEYMNVSQYQGQNGIQYTLQFWNDSAKCGILTFMQQNGSTGCEMYVWDNHVNETIMECEKAYVEWCKVNASQVYFSNCTRDDRDMC